jgi:hypothetical protein
MTPAGENELSAMSKDPQRLIRVPIGAVSPLWGLFAGAAVSGAAWWWMTRWARPANLEAVFGAVEQPKTEIEPEVEALAAPVAEAAEAAPVVIEPVVEAAAETIEPVIEEAPPPPVAEALIEAAPEPVGGEAAPISPVLQAMSPEVAEPVAEPAIEAAAEPKPAPKPKKTAPKVD